ncbi:transposase [Luteolibacter pohnpeiensis]|uniref:Transposase n=1 Tax=Luteolibacter pohnpeiensis TaxID=454153 RepID=A0A934S8T8_9BACT|nr:transposase [Luteolibacter pohnpeiensis]
MSPEREQQLLNEIARRDERIAQLELENKLLSQKLDLVLRKLFGSSSEKLDVGQLELSLDPDALKKPPVAGGAPAAEELAVIKRRPDQSRKPRIPEHLPVEEIFLDPEPVKACPQAWRCIGEEVSEQLDYRPGKFLRRRLIRRKYVRLAAKAAPPVIAALPVRLQDGCLATPGLIAEILVNKYAWSLPLYRQESLFRQRHDVAIPRQTMMNWEALAADRLMPLYQLLKRHLLESSYLQIDEWSGATWTGANATCPEGVRPEGSIKHPSATKNPAMAKPKPATIGFIVVRMASFSTIGGRDAPTFTLMKSSATTVTLATRPPSKASSKATATPPTKRIAEPLPPAVKSSSLPPAGSTRDASFLMPATNRPGSLDSSCVRSATSTPLNRASERPEPDPPCEPPPAPAKVIPFINGSGKSSVC